MQKVSITSDATLWAELAKCRHENFCSPFLRVASVESTRIYEKLVAKKVKDTPRVYLVHVCKQQALKNAIKIGSLWRRVIQIHGYTLKTGGRKNYL